jgi:hypothetical protein
MSGTAARATTGSVVNPTQPRRHVQGRRGPVWTHQRTRSCETGVRHEPGTARQRAEQGMIVPTSGSAARCSGDADPAVGVARTGRWRTCVPGQRPGGVRRRVFGSCPLQQVGAVTGPDRRDLNSSRVFNQVSELHDRVRPEYPDELFADPALIAGIDGVDGMDGMDGGASVLDLGCGTGQATPPAGSASSPTGRRLRQSRGRDPDAREPGRPRPPLRCARCRIGVAPGRPVDRAAAGARRAPSRSFDRRTRSRCRPPVYAETTDLRERASPGKPRPGSSTARGSRTRRRPERGTGQRPRRPVQRPDHAPVSTVQ